MLSSDTLHAHTSSFSWFFRQGTWKIHGWYCWKWKAAVFPGAREMLRMLSAWGVITGYLLPTPQYANTSFKRLINQQSPKLLLEHPLICSPHDRNTGISLEARQEVNSWPFGSRKGNDFVWHTSLQHTLCCQDQGCCFVPNRLTSQLTIHCQSLRPLKFNKEIQTFFKTSGSFNTPSPSNMKP